MLAPAICNDAFARFQDRLLLCHHALNSAHVLCRADLEVAVPLEVCCSLWEDRERISLWMPWSQYAVLPTSSICNTL
jgi:hypothetical protein